MKTPEELNALKEEVETVSRKLHELTEEELAQVTGGLTVQFDVPVKKDDDTCSMEFTKKDSNKIFQYHIYKDTLTNDF